MGMRLPEFRGTRRTSLQATSQRATVDRTPEFAAKSRTGQMINQFSEQIEQKRYNANVNKFRREETLATQQEWANAQESLTKATRSDGTVDNTLLQSDPNAAQWGGIETTDDRYDSYVNKWWSTRIASGTERANNEDQKQAYLAATENDFLRNSTRATTFYNSQQLKSNIAAAQKESDTLQKLLTTGDTLPDTENLHLKLKQLFDGIDDDVGVLYSPAQAETLKDSFKQSWAVGIADNITRIYEVEAAKGGAGDKAIMKKSATQLMQFVRGLSKGKKKAEVNIKNVMTDEQLGAKAAQDAFNGLDEEVKKNLNLDEIKEASKKQMDQVFSFTDPLTLVAGDLLGQSMSPEQQMNYMKRAAKMAIQENVYTAGDLVQTLNDYTAVAREGRIDPKSDEFTELFSGGAAHVINKISENAAFSDVTKTRYMLEAIRSEEFGHMKNRMSMASLSEVEDMIKNYDSVLDGAREMAQKKYPEAAKFFQKGFDAKAMMQDKAMLRRMKDEQMVELRRDSATYMITYDSGMRAQVNTALQALMNGNSRGAQSAITNFINSATAKAQELGIPKSKTTVLPSNIKDWFTNQFAPQRGDDKTGRRQAGFFQFAQPILGDRWEEGYAEIIEHANKGGANKLDGRTQVLGYLYNPEAMADVFSDIDYDPKKAFANRPQALTEISELMPETMVQFRRAFAGASMSRHHARIADEMERAVQSSAQQRMANNPDLSAKDAVQGAYDRIVGSSYAFTESGKSNVYIPQPVLIKYPQMQRRVESFIESNDSPAELSKFNLKIPAQYSERLMRDVKGITTGEIRKRFNKQISENSSWRKSPNRPGVELMFNTGTQWIHAINTDGEPVYVPFKDVNNKVWTKK